MPWPEFPSALSPADVCTPEQRRALLGLIVIEGDTELDADAATRFAAMQLLERRLVDEPAGVVLLPPRRPGEPGTMVVWVPVTQRSCA